ncbi:MAG TPA: ABC transporter substrate-binding protein [Vicinamibacteria bacterium]|nr:ABC transporter substrate-binding protein [Vicinamibacteria bacterium]
MPTSILSRAASVTGALCLATCVGPRGPSDDVLRIGASYELTSLDPHREDTLSNSALLSNVYEPLVATDTDMKLVPRLAHAWENPDPRTWIFRLRRGVAFHDGRPFSAADVAASLARLRGDPLLEMGKKLSGVEEVRVRDDVTLELRTREPDRTFLQKLTGVLILPHGARGPEGIGTGPYRIEAWSARRLSLTRFEGYWGPEAPFLRAEYDLGLPPRAALEAVRLGRTALAEAQGHRVSLADAARFGVARRESLYTKFLGFDLARTRSPGVPGRSNPFRDRRVRRALHLALDRVALVARLSTDAEPASQPVPRSVFGFHPGLPEPRHDLGAARELLRQAGLGGGFAGVLHTRHVLEEPARLVAADLRALGVRLDVEALPDAEFFEALRRREASVWLDRVACISGDAYEFLADFLHSPDPSRRLGRSNELGLADPELDRAIEASAEIEDDMERREALGGLLARVMDELPVLPLFVDRDAYVYDRRIAFAPRYDGEIRAYEIGRASVAGASGHAARSFSAKREARNGHRS